MKTDSNFRSFDLVDILLILSICGHQKLREVTNGILIEVPKLMVGLMNIVLNCVWKMQGK